MNYLKRASKHSNMSATSTAFLSAALSAFPTAATTAERCAAALDPIDLEEAFAASVESAGLNYDMIRPNISDWTLEMLIDTIALTDHKLMIDEIKLKVFAGEIMHQICINYNMERDLVPDFMYDYLPTITSIGQKEEKIQVINVSSTPTNLFLRFNNGKLLAFMGDIYQFKTSYNPVPKTYNCFDNPLTAFTFCREEDKAEKEMREKASQELNDRIEQYVNDNLKEMTPTDVMQLIQEYINDAGLKAKDEFLKHCLETKQCLINLKEYNDYKKHLEEIGEYESIFA